MDNIYLNFSEDDLQKWLSRELIKKWRKQYPGLMHDHHFDSIVNSSNEMTTFTFYEYFTGFTFANKGYKFIFEPYIENFLLQDYKSDELIKLKIKFTNIVKEIIGNGKFKLLKTICQNFKTGQPDLFIYKEDGSDYFFAECKSERDELRSHQEKLINALTKIIPVKMVYLIKK